MQDDKTLEIHVPKKYTTERPALTFTHDKFLDIGIEEHPVACQLHHPTPGPSIQDVPADHPPFAARPDFPKTLDDMIRRRMPQLLLHVTSFSDATFVSLVWPHSVADATGIMALLKNWSLVLANRTEEVQPVLGAREDIMLESESAEAESDREQLKLLPKRLTGLNLLIWAFRHFWYQFWSPPLQSKTVFVPKQVFSRLRGQIQEEVDGMPRTDGHKSFASENDMLTAWVTQIVASSEPTPRPMTVLTLLNVRGVLSQVVNSGGLYVQNMVILTYNFLSTQLLKGPTGEIAVAHRRQFAEQKGEKQVLS